MQFPSKKQGIKYNQNQIQYETKYVRASWVNIPAKAELSFDTSNHA